VSQNRVELRVQVLEQDETTWSDAYRGKRIVAVGLTYPSVSQDADSPLEDVTLLITLTREDDRAEAIRRFYGRWPAAPADARRIDLPPQQYQRVLVYGMATQGGAKVRIHGEWEASLP
jgi:hypothetical protein